MLAAAVTLALFALIIAAVVDVLRSDARKIVAALEGCSWAAAPGHGRPVTIRFSRPDKDAGAVKMQPVLRAAA